MKKAIFLDRDGVINKDVGLLYKKKDVKILPNVIKALKKLKEKDYLIVVITNQPVIARGLITEKRLIELNNFLNSLIENLIDEFYFCPHHPNANLEIYRRICECRKPAPGLILRAAKDLDIDLTKSWMIGDMPSDIVSGKSAGLKTILIESEKNKKVIETGKKWDIEESDYKSKNLLDALKYIK
ncbi:HAD family hydrolase [Candidatus Pacearchaeota archaeon]|nr:HAD family hydrolase [Candidatus Pacearchaeota archaeon]